MNARSRLLAGALLLVAACAPAEDAQQEADVN